MLTRYLALSIPLIALLGACTYPRVSQPPRLSRAFDRAMQTDLGRRSATLAAEHPGDSGLHVLRTGLEAFAARIALIDRAEQAIDAQYYIFHDDVTGRWLLSKLVEAADRGVRVRLLLDDMGSAGIDDVIAAADAHPGLEIRLFNPSARGPWPGLARTLDLLWRPRLLNHRMHNKLLVGDGAAAIVGGRNVGDEYFDASEGVNFADLDLLAFGPVTAELGECFDMYWNSRFAVPLTAWDSFAREPADLLALTAELREHRADHANSRFGERLLATGFVREALAGELALVWAPTHAVVDLPEKIVARGEAIRETLLIKRAAEHWPPAESELIIVSPYFVPRERGVEHLAGLVERGVRVRVLTNALAATDVHAVHAGYAAHRRDLLAAGVELHELRPTGDVVMEGFRKGFLGSASASLHAKTFIADGRRVFVGSLNLDPRSAILNTELGLVAESAELAGELKERFEIATHPGTSWRVCLEKDELRWEGERGGEIVRLDAEPEAGWLTRCAVTILGWLPIEGQL
ncbi:MAG: phospholipase D family protein [Planctomycetota bacterium]|jgi:putative cardiolipin synthase